jgi:hypothetical protein
MKFTDEGNRIIFQDDTKITPATIKENKIIKINLTTIQRAQIIQAVKNINKKYGRKLIRVERELFLRRLSKKLGRKLLKEDYAIINERLIEGRKREDTNKDIKTKGGIIFGYKEGIGMVRVLEKQLLKEEKLQLQKDENAEDLDEDGDNEDE